MREVYLSLTEEKEIELLKIAYSKGREDAKKEIEKERKRVLRNESPGRRAQKMLSDYTRIKRDLKDTEFFTPEEAAEIRWRVVSDFIENKEDKAEANINNEKRRRQNNRYQIYRLERALKLYGEEVENGSKEDKRRYKELCQIYIEEPLKTVQEVAENEDLSEKTVYKDLCIAYEIVGAYLFGI